MGGAARKETPFNYEERKEKDDEGREGRKQRKFFVFKAVRTS